MSDILGKIISSETPEALWKIVRTYFREHNVSKISYHHFGGLLSSPNAVPGLAVHTSGFPVDWVQHYVSDELSRVDPIPELARSSLRPFYWRDVGNLVALNSDQRAYMREMEAAKLGDGLAFQVFGPGMRNGYVGLGLLDGTPRWSEDRVLRFQAVGQAGHLRYCELTPDVTTLPPLSPREKEILHWMSRGKSNSSIASILEVSRHTVDTLVRRIFDKLQATDRTTASLRGIGAGVIPIRA